MNKEQLEKIRNKCKEIKELIQLDIEGTHWLKENFVKFSDMVDSILKDLVWNEYNQTNK